jgi:hypothetical protein
VCARAAAGGRRQIAGRCRPRWGRRSAVVGGVARRGSGEAVPDGEDAAVVVWWSARGGGGGGGVTRTGSIHPRLTRLLWQGTVDGGDGDDGGDEALGMPMRNSGAWGDEAEHVLDHVGAVVANPSSPGSSGGPCGCSTAGRSGAGTGGRGRTRGQAHDAEEQLDHERQPPATSRTGAMARLASTGRAANTDTAAAWQRRTKRRRWQVPAWR